MDCTEIEKFYAAAYAFVSTSMGAVSRRAATTAQEMTRSKFGIEQTDWTEMFDNFAGGMPRYDFMSPAKIIETSGYPAADFE